MNYRMLGQQVEAQQFLDSDDFSKITLIELQTRGPNGPYYIMVGSQIKGLIVTDWIVKWPNGSFSIQPNSAFEVLIRGKI